MFANVCRIPGPGSILRVSGFRARNRRVNRELKRAGSNNPGFKFPGPGNPARCPSLELTAITPSAAGSADYFTVYNLTFCPFSYALFEVALRRSSGPRGCPFVRIYSIYKVLPFIGFYITPRPLIYPLQPYVKLQITVGKSMLVICFLFM